MCIYDYRIIDYARQMKIAAAVCLSRSKMVNMAERVKYFYEISTGTILQGEHSHLSMRCLTISA